RFAVWTDLVDYQVIRLSAEGSPLVRRVYRQYALSPMVKSLPYHLIRRSTLGLFHGMDCYREYAPICRNPHVVHNIHVKPGDAVGLDVLRRKADEIRSGARLRLGYLGRADLTKGAMDWIEVLRVLRDRGHDFEATWLGDGPRLEEMRRRVDAMGLGEQV